METNYHKTLPHVSEVFLFAILFIAQVRDRRPVHTSSQHFCGGKGQSIRIVTVELVKIDADVYRTKEGAFCR